jgi:hypothetical protein
LGWIHPINSLVAAALLLAALVIAMAFRVHVGGGPCPPPGPQRARAGLCEAWV